MPKQIKVITSNYLDTDQKFIYLIKTLQNFVEVYGETVFAEHNLYDDGITHVCYMRNETKQEKQARLKKQTNLHEKNKIHRLKKYLELKKEFKDE